MNLGALQQNLNHLNLFLPSNTRTLAELFDVSMNLGALQQKPLSTRYHMSQYEVSMNQHAVSINLGALQAAIFAAFL